MRGGRSSPNRSGARYGIANALGGSGFIAAFVGGALFGLFAGGKAVGMMGLTEQTGEALDSVNFLVSAPCRSARRSST